MLSAITPPVAIASFAAAGIAGSPPMKTGWESMRVGSIIYFIPFFFVLNPAFVLQGPLWESLLLALNAAAGILFICGGLQGYQTFVGDLRKTGRFEWVLRSLLALGGITLAAPGSGIMPFSHLQMTALALAAPGGGIMPLSHAQMAWLALALLAPTLGAAFWLVRRR